MSLEIGAPAPTFTLPDQNRKPVSLDDLKGRTTVIVFIPFPFTGICDGEACSLRDNLSELQDLDANVVVITAHAVPTNKHWAEENGFSFPVLSDFWPHGEVSRAYGCFNEALGVPERCTVILDADHNVRRVIRTESLGVGRDIEELKAALTEVAA